MIERKNGVSGIMRVRNDAEFLAASIESSLPALDELVIVYNACEDNSPEIIKSYSEKYPGKIKTYEYIPEILAWNLSDREVADVFNGTIPEENTLAGYYNFALNRTSYKFAIKIDSDQIYFTDKLKEVCDLYRNEAKSMKTAFAFICSYIFKKLFSISVRFENLPRILSSSSFWETYLRLLKAGLLYKKVCTSFSGINLVVDKGVWVSMGKEIEGGRDILPPYNGEGDHLIFEVTDSTKYVPVINDGYNNKNGFGKSVIERFVGDKGIYPMGFLWIHLSACRKTTYSETLRLREMYPERYMPLEKFISICSELIRKIYKCENNAAMRVYFQFVHSDLKKNRIEIVKSLNRVYKIT